MAANARSEKYTTLRIVKSVFGVFWLEVKDAEKHNTLYLGVFPHYTALSSLGIDP